MPTQNSDQIISFPVSNILLLFAVVFMLGIAPGHDIYALIPSPYDEKRFTQLLVIGLCCMAAILSYPLRRTIQNVIINTPSPVRITLLAIAVLGFVSAYRSPAPEYAFLEFTLHSGLALFTLCIAALVIHNQKLTINTVLYTLIVFAAIYEVAFFSSYVAAHIIDGKLNTKVIHSGFANIRFFNQYQIWSLPILCLPFFLQPQLPRKLRIPIFIISVFWVTLLLATESRGAVLAYISALLITAIFFRTRAMPLIKINGLCIAVGVVIYTLLFIIPPFLMYTDTLISNKVVSTTSSLARLQLWSQALIYIQESPWLGIGPMHYAYYPNKIGAHPHNSILQLAAELGIPAALLIISLLVRFLIKWVRNVPAETTDSQTSTYVHIPILWIALFCSLISGLIYSQVSGVIVTPMGQSMLALLIGIMIGLQFLRNNETYPAFEKQKSIFMPISIISGIILIALTYLVTPQLTTRILTPFWGQYLPYHTVGPRFWRFGGIIQVPRSR